MPHQNGSHSVPYLGGGRLQLITFGVPLIALFDEARLHLVQRPERVAQLVERRRASGVSIRRRLFCLRWNVDWSLTTVILVSPNNNATGNEKFVEDRPCDANYKDVINLLPFTFFV